MAYFIPPVWALILIPLYLFIPSSSMLWRWPICTLFGAVAGFLIVSLVFGVFLASVTFQAALGPLTV
jgi:hypothetical protein